MKGLPSGETIESVTRARSEALGTLSEDYNEGYNDGKKEMATHASLLLLQRDEAHKAEVDNLNRLYEACEKRNEQLAHLVLQWQEFIEWAENSEWYYSSKNIWNTEGAFNTAKTKTTSELFDLFLKEKERK